MACAPVVQAFDRGLDHVEKVVSQGTIADGLDVPGLDLVLDSRVPLGSGLSSSAALECAVALAGNRPSQFVD